MISYVVVLFQSPAFVQDHLVDVQEAISNSGNEAFIHNDNVIVRVNESSSIEESIDEVTRLCNDAGLHVYIEEYDYKFESVMDMYLNDPAMNENKIETKEVETKELVTEGNLIRTTYILRSQKDFDEVIRQLSLNYLVIEDIITFTFTQTGIYVFGKQGNLITDVIVVPKNNLYSQNEIIEKCIDICFHAQSLSSDWDRTDKEDLSYQMQHVSFIVASLLSQFKDDGFETDCVLNELICDVLSTKQWREVILKLIS